MQKYIKLFFMIYILALIKLIVFKYPYEQLIETAGNWRPEVISEGLERANFIPFKTVKMYIVYADRLNSFENLAGNILAFVPFGMIFPLIDTGIKNWLHVIGSALILVIEIELFQLLSGFGSFDVDDIILNCFGAVLGYVLYFKSRRLRNLITYY